jgi:hypothetical protein
MPQETQRMNGFMELEVVESRVYLRNYDARYFDPYIMGNIVFSDSYLQCISQ